MPKDRQCDIAAVTGVGCRCSMTWFQQCRLTVYVGNNAAFAVTSLAMVCALARYVLYGLAAK